MKMSPAEFMMRFPSHAVSKELAGVVSAPAKKTAKKIAGPSILESTFAQQVLAMKLPTPETEYVFHPDRKWRMDFAWPEQKVAVELEGGIWTNGRHTRPHGFLNDAEKYNMACSMGWKVLRFTGRDIRSGKAVDQTLSVLNAIHLALAPEPGKMSRTAKRAGMSC